MLLRTCFSAFVFLAAAVVGVGQPPGDSTETDRPEELRQRLKMSRQNRVELQIRRLVQALKLDETQVEQVRGILQKEDEARRALNANDAVPQSLKDEIQAVAEEWGEAREAGDPERLKELREKRLELGRKAREFGMLVLEEARALREVSREQILTILRADQIESFDTYWEKNMRGPRSSGRARNPALLKRLVDRLPDLTVQQKSQVDALFKAHVSGAKPSGLEPREPRDSRGARWRLDKLFDDVYAVLTERQKKVIQEKVERRPGSRKQSGVRKPKKPDEPPSENE